MMAARCGMSLLDVMTCGTPWWHVARYGVALPLSTTGRECDFGL